MRPSVPIRPVETHDAADVTVLYNSGSYYVLSI